MTTAPTLSHILAITATLTALTWLDVNVAPVAVNALPHFEPELSSRASQHANSGSLQIREKRLKKMLRDVERWERKNDRKMRMHQRRLDVYCGLWESWCYWV